MRREETLLFAKKKEKEERNKKINIEKARKFPPRNCKGNKGIMF